MLRAIKGARVGLGVLVAMGVGVGVSVGLDVGRVRSPESSPPMTPQLRGRNNAKRANTMNLGTVRFHFPESAVISTLSQQFRLYKVN